MSFDHLKLVIVGDILFPKNRQVNLNIIKVIASFIGIVGSEFVAGYRVDKRVNASGDVELRAWVHEKNLKETLAY